MSPDDSAASSPSIMDALLQVSGFCGVPLRFVVDFVDDLKCLVAEKAYAEMHIEMKRGKVWHKSIKQTTQYSAIE